MENPGYLRIFRDRWIAIVLGVLIGVWVASAVAASIPPTYSATATLFLSVQSDAGSLNERSQFALARITSYPQLAESSDVLSKTISDLGLNESVQQLSKSISASNPPTTVLLQITAQSDTPERAAELANTVASNLSTVVSELENAPNDARYSVALEPRIPAQAPTSPSSPQLTVILGLGLIAGLALGLIAAIVWSRLDTGIRSVSEVRRISGLPVLGQLPSLWSASGAPGERRKTKSASLFRETQLAIRQANAAIVPDLLALVPASRTAGGLGVRVGFARAFAATGRSVCLVESDFSGGIEVVAPTARGAQGLAEVLGDDKSSKPYIGRVEGESFSLLAAGLPSNLPRESDAEQRIRRVTHELVSAFDVTLIQVTSISKPASLELVGPYADGVVVVVRHGRTRTADLAHTLSRLRVMGVRPLGIVMTGVPAHRRRDLAAGWLPGDFNETRRSPVLSRGDPAAGEIAPAAKRRSTPRIRRAPATSVVAPEAEAGTGAAELPIDDFDSTTVSQDATDNSVDVAERQTSSVD